MSINGVCNFGSWNKALALKVREGAIRNSFKFAWSHLWTTPKVEMDNYKHTHLESKNIPTWWWKKWVRWSQFYISNFGLCLCKKNPIQSVELQAIQLITQSIMVIGSVNAALWRLVTSKLPSSYLINIFVFVLFFVFLRVRSWFVPLFYRELVLIWFDFRFLQVKRYLCKQRWTQVEV